MDNDTHAKAALALPQKDRSSADSDAISNTKKPRLQYENTLSIVAKVAGFTPSEHARAALAIPACGRPLTSRKAILDTRRIRIYKIDMLFKAVYVVVALEKLVMFHSRDGGDLYIQYQMLIRDQQIREEFILGLVGFLFPIGATKDRVCNEIRTSIFYPKSAKRLNQSIEPYVELMWEMASIGEVEWWSYRRFSKRSLDGLYVPPVQINRILSLLLPFERQAMFQGSYEGIFRHINFANMLTYTFGAPKLPKSAEDYRATVGLI